MHGDSGDIATQMFEFTAESVSLGRGFPNISQHDKCRFTSPLT
jgi:hypothetical protein